MQAKIISWKLIALIFGALVVVLLILLPNMQERYSRRKLQEPLAQRLGVNIDDYPFPSSFPVGYFYTILKPEMSFNEVHQIVQGYDRAYLCFGKTEIYYYFGESEIDAIRFWIYYNDRGSYLRMEGEDDDSRLLFVNDKYLHANCIVGTMQ